MPGPSLAPDRTVHPPCPPTRKPCSFNDIVKRLAAQPETDPTFVNKRVRRQCAQNLPLHNRAVPTPGQPAQLSPNRAGVAAALHALCCSCLVQVDRVERFVVAHGQIFVNQFQNYPREPACLGLQSV